MSPFVLDPLPDPEHGQHLTVAEFKDWVRMGVVNDYDGGADWATETGVSHEPVSCEEIAANILPPGWATHVVWYSK